MNYTMEEIELYFSEYLKYYDSGSIYLLLFNLQYEKEALDNAPKVHDKSRFKKYHTSLDLIKKDLQPNGEEQVAIRTLKNLIEKRMGTKKDIKEEFESRFPKAKDCPIFKKLLKDARAFIAQ